MGDKLSRMVASYRKEEQHEPVNSSVPLQEDQELHEPASSMNSSVSLHEDQEHSFHLPTAATAYPQAAKIDMKECQDVVCVGNITANVVNVQNIPASKERKSSGPIPGTLAQETLDLRIEEAHEAFVPTQSFIQAKYKLAQFGHVTICGASGEGKTTMALMLSSEYENKGYDIVFVEKVDTFDFNYCISAKEKFILIVDDIFDTVRLSTEIMQLRRFFHSLKSHIQDSSKMSERHSSVKSKQRSEDNDDCGHRDERRDIRVVFTSKTYNFKEAISMLEYERLTIFKDDSVVQLTGKKSCCYSKEEKVAIFEKYNQMHFASVEEKTEYLWELDKMLFGFPLTCRLYFEFPDLIQDAEDFFRHPLFYLKLEIKSLLGLRNDVSAALMLMVLCEDTLDMAKLELRGSDQEMDMRHEAVTDIVPSATRSGIAIAARNLTGTYFFGRDLLRFTHSSIYDTCSYAMYHFNQAFVLQYCSYDFLYERVKPDTEPRGAEHLSFIYLTSSYYDLFATKLARGMTEGYFANTVTHPTLEDEQLVALLFQNLKVESYQLQNTDTPWEHQKDKGKGLLYWAVLGPSPVFVSEIENEMNIKFEPEDVIESLDGCIENNDLMRFKLLLSKLDDEYDNSLKNKLLLLSAESVSFDIAQYLVDDGADINATNDDMQNYFHIACQMGKSKMLSYRVLQAFITDSNQQIAINARDNNGRTPIMIAALSGSSECFQFLREVSNFDIHDNYGDSPLHLACVGGDIGIVQQVLTSSNINIRGEYGWTPVMNAAVEGHQKVFELLVSKDADLTLMDDYGNSVLHLACRGGNTDIVQQALTPSNINSRGIHGMTPVMTAAVYGQHAVFEILVANDADLTLVNDNGDLLLHMACSGGNRDIVQHVLTPLNVNSRGDQGWTPVMYAAASGQQRVFDFLVANNADITMLPDSGDTLLKLACQGDNREIIQYVLTPSSCPDTYLTDATAVEVCDFTLIQSEETFQDVLAVDYCITYEK